MAFYRHAVELVDARTPDGPSASEPPTSCSRSGKTSSHRSSRPPAPAASSRSARSAARTPSSCWSGSDPTSSCTSSTPCPPSIPSEHEERFAGQYVFHRDLSVNVLADLPPMDVALIDGDHNWYTVYTELNLLADVARTADAPLPSWFSTTSGWPYGRRDLYYDPTNIPDEHLQPWQRGGHAARSVRSCRTSGGGMNPTLANAEHEGGPRTTAS